MKTITETILAVFDPDSAFEITLHTANEELKSAIRLLSTIQPALPMEDASSRRGSSASALND